MQDNFIMNTQTQINSNLKLLAPDLRAGKQFPRSPRATLAGYVLAARALDKCRAVLVGTEGEYHANCPLDQQWLKFAEIEFEAFREVVASGATDDEVAALDASLLHKAEAQVSRLVRLANRLLDLSRLEGGHSGPPRERLDLRRPIEDTLDLWTARHDEARFRIELPALPCMVECDRGGIEQVLTNLVDNALKFSPSEAPITIRLSVAEDRAWVEVEDQGVGIDARSLEHIFDRFYQAEHGRKRQGGFGLGLYISRKIIEDHAGEIEIQSREGGPTRVTFRLPLLQH